MEKIRIGVFGARRGSSFFEIIQTLGGEIVAVCDKNKEYREKAVKLVNGPVVEYDDFDEFIEHPMDAVFLANYFHEHAPFAIRALEKDIHVLSECTASSTMAESVALVRAAEKSKAFYMLCENYPFMLFNQELKRICDGGTLGRIVYAEGEYNHPGDPNAPVEWTRLIYDSDKHWRMFLPRTYYITHSLAPLMYATGVFPKRVTAMPVAPDRELSSAGRVPEIAAVLTCQNDDNSVFKVVGHSSWGGHFNTYRFCGEKGMAENVRGAENTIALNYSPWYAPEGKPATTFYPAVCTEPEIEEHVKKAGHAGGDFYIIREFFNAIRENKKPVMDEYFATTLASVAILGHRSVLDGGTPFDIPNFHNEEDRVKYENDKDSPFWYSDGTAPTIPCSYNTDYKPTEESLVKIRELIK